MRSENSIQDNAVSGQAFSEETLARLWPNRVHESNWVKSLLCRLGFHRWQEMQFGPSVALQKARFCRWCPEIKVLQSRKR
jgi:hypothetical protein